MHEARPALVLGTRREGRLDPAIDLEEIELQAACGFCLPQTKQALESGCCMIDLLLRLLLVQAALDLGLDRQLGRRQTALIPLAEDQRRVLAAEAKRVRRAI